jgi:methionyl aminopeptidase
MKFSLFAGRHAGSDERTRNAAREAASAMPVTIKNTPEERDGMRQAGRLAAQVLDMIGEHVQPGVSTDELDQICHEYITGTLGAVPAPLNYKGFPKSICTSINHVVCHGIPGERRLKRGDIVNIDITVIKDGWHGDTSRMFYVGEPTVIGRRVSEVSYVEGQNCSVVREYCGHGIGREFHEDPQVLHHGKPGTGMTLVPGMTFTIEPMVNAGKPQVRLLPDQWTVVTKDHSLSAQWEHTILVTEDGHEVLTLGAEGRS